jgi:hypothetical protein
MRTLAKGRLPIDHFSPESRSRLKGLAAERMSRCWTGEVVPDSDMLEIAVGIVPLKPLLWRGRGCRDPED